MMNPPNSPSVSVSHSPGLSDRNSPAASKDCDDGGQKLCKVCGDRALGFNFNVVTCESCKAFFRRNALKEKPLVCHFTGTCDVNPVSRRFCQKCRLQKCFSVGMKKEAIMTEDALLDKRARLNSARKTKRPGDCDSSSAPSRDDSSGSSPIKKPAIGETDGTIFEAKPTHGSASNLLSFAEMQGEATTSSAALQAVTELVTIPKAVLIGLVEQVNTASKTISSLAFCSSCGTRLRRGQNIYSGSRSGYKESRSGAGSGVMSSVAQDNAQARHSSNSLLQQTSSFSPTSSLESSPDSASSIAHSTMSVCSPVTKFDVAYTMAPYGGPQSSAPLSTHGFSPVVVSGPDGMTQNSKILQGQSVSWASSSDQNLDRAGTAKVCICGVGDLSTVIDAAIAAEFMECCPNMGLPESSRVPGFTDVEQSRFDELLIANEVMDEPIERIPESQLNNVAQALDQPRLIDVINMTDIVIKRMIRMSKQLTGFQGLCQEDQIALLKGGCTEIMILRGVMRCDPEKNTWNGPFSQIKMEILKEAKGRSFYEDHAKFIRSLKPSVRTCEPVMLLMSTICLFTPTRPNVVNAGDIKNEQDMYFSILNKYLESLYNSGEEARSVYSHVIQKIEELHKLNDQTVKIFLDANPKELEPLLIEIFDLKQ